MSDAVALAVLFYLAVFTAIYWAWLIRHRRHQAEAGRMVECDGCGRRLPASKARVIVGQHDHGPQGGSGAIGEYHPGCVP